MLMIRKKLGLTQSELAEIAGVWDRTHADIERGTVNMRVETALKICGVFHVTPNEIFTKEETPLYMKRDNLPSPSQSLPLFSFSIVSSVNPV